MVGHNELLHVSMNYYIQPIFHEGSMQSVLYLRHQALPRSL